MSELLMSLELRHVSLMYHQSETSRIMVIIFQIFKVAVLVLITGVVREVRQHRATQGLGKSR
jgi:uncharacterized membrane protein